MSHKLNMKYTLLTGIGINAIRGFAMAPPLSSASAYFWSTLGLQMLDGVAIALAATANFTIVIRLFKDRAPVLLAVVESFYYFGIISGPLLGGALYELYGYACPFIASAVAYTILFLLSVAFIPNQKTEDNGK